MSAATQPGFGPTGNPDHVRFQLEQAEVVLTQAARQGWREKGGEEGRDDPLWALLQISYAAGMARAIARAWIGMGETDKARDLHARADAFFDAATKLIESLADES
jgi:hypothetical protein